MIWRELINFSSGANCLVLASLPYIEAEYVRDYQEFLKLKN
ncbi:MAG: WxcM-like domain-containing protein [Deltaproteobacteria bacterium]|nr:WxcM-like domain-containing protein [Deltaproteobacteria bacterium]MBW2011401.1 WxcM-like domain-containing protein [Deltaproteobacteria bacterium]MBW2099985.1 WxcM-like domain-containing protein [Deltaproteobacteria bacterium]